MLRRKEQVVEGRRNGARLVLSKVKIKAKRAICHKLRRWQKGARLMNNQWQVARVLTAE